MEIVSVSLHDLRKMNDSEGLILKAAAATLKNGLTA